MADALVVPGSTMFFNYQTHIANLSAKKKLPTISAWRQLPEAGGLMSYGANIPDVFRRAASYIDKILKGAKPGDLPVERAVRAEFIINLQTAKDIGLTIPPEVLQQADKVIK
jgi:putative ABC transport system substrate-binding protein